jgi:hypothetical protein
MKKHVFFVGMVKKKPFQNFNFFFEKNIQTLSISVFSILKKQVFFIFIPMIRPYLRVAGLYPI